MFDLLSMVLTCVLIHGEYGGGWVLSWSNSTVMKEGAHLPTPVKCSPRHLCCLVGIGIGITVVVHPVVIILMIGCWV